MLLAWLSLTTADGEKYVDFRELQKRVLLYRPLKKNRRITTVLLHAEWVLQEIINEWRAKSYLERQNLKNSQFRIRCCFGWWGWDVGLLQGCLLLCVLSPVHYLFLSSISSSWVSKNLEHSFNIGSVSSHLHIKAKIPNNENCFPNLEGGVWPEGFSIVQA